RSSTCCVHRGWAERPPPRPRARRGCCGRGKFYALDGTLMTPVQRARVPTCRCRVPGRESWHSGTLRGSTYPLCSRSLLVSVPQCQLSLPGTVSPGGGTLAVDTCDAVLVRQLPGPFPAALRGGYPELALGAEQGSSCDAVSLGGFLDILAGHRA